MMDMYNQTLKYRNRLHILCGFSLFLTCKFSHFVGQNIQKKPFVSNAVRSVWRANRCGLFVNHYVGRVTVFMRFPSVSCDFPLETNCKWPFLDHLANGEKEWPFVVGQ